MRRGVDVGCWQALVWHWRLDGDPNNERAKTDVLPCLPLFITTITCYRHQHMEPRIITGMEWRDTFSLRESCTFWVQTIHFTNLQIIVIMRTFGILGRMTAAVAHYQHVLRLTSLQSTARGKDAELNASTLDGWRVEAETGLRLAAKHLAATCRQNYGSCNSVDDLLSLQ